MSARILLLEDDAVFASELSRALAGIGCEVTVVNEGNEGLARAPEARPDLVIVAAELRGVNGFRICNKLKKNPAMKRVPVFLLAGDSSPETVDLHQRLATRAEQYFRKPIALDDLVSRMRAHVAAFRDDGDVPVDFEDAPTENGVVPVALAPPRPTSTPSRAPRPTSTKVRAAAVVEEELSVASVDLDAVSALRARLTKQDEANAALMVELGNVRAALGTATADARAKAAEAARLRNELAARPVANAGDLPRASLPPANAASAREALKLRETITAKDRELLALRDELGASRQEAAEAKARGVSTEQAARTAEQTVHALEAQAAALQASLLEARRDKEQATRRAEDARKRFERVAPDLQSVEGALAEERGRRAADAEAHAAVLRELETLRARERGEWNARAADLEAAVREREREAATVSEQVREAREAANAAAARATALSSALDETRAHVEVERRGVVDGVQATSRVRAELEARVAEERDARARAEQAREHDIREVQRERANWTERAQTLRQELAAAIAELESARGLMEAERQRAADAIAIAEETRAQERVARKSADVAAAQIAALGHSLAQAHSVRRQEEQRRAREVEAAEARSRTLEAALVDRDRAWTEQMEMLRRDHDAAVRAIDVDVARVRAAHGAALASRAEAERLVANERSTREHDAVTAAAALEDVRRDLATERDRHPREAEERAAELADAAAARDRDHEESERRREADAAAHATALAERDRLHDVDRQARHAEHLTALDRLRAELSQTVHEEERALHATQRERERAEAEARLATELTAARASAEENERQLRAEAEVALRTAARELAEQRAAAVQDIAQRERDVRRELERRVEEHKAERERAVDETRRAARQQAEQLQSIRDANADAESRLRGELDAAVGAARSLEAAAQNRDRAHADEVQRLRAEHAAALQAARLEMEAPLASALADGRARAEQLAALEVTLERARDEAARMDAERTRTASDGDARVRALEATLAERERTAATEAERTRTELASVRSDLEATLGAARTAAQEIGRLRGTIAREREAHAGSRAALEARVTEVDASGRASDAREARVRVELDAAREDTRLAFVKIETERQRADEAARAVMLERDAHEQRTRDAVAEETVRRARELSDIQQLHQAELAKLRERERTAILADLGEQTAPFVEEATALGERLRIAEGSLAAVRREHEAANAQLAAAHERETGAVRARVDELTQALARSRQALDLERRTQIQEELVTSTQMEALEEQLAAHKREAADLAIRLDEARVALPSLEAEVGTLRTEIGAARATIEDQSVAARAANEQLERDRLLLSRAQEALVAVLTRAREPTS